MADDRIDVVFGADVSELVSGAQQVKDQLSSLTDSARSTGEAFIGAGQEAGEKATTGYAAWSATFDLIGATTETVLHMSQTVLQGVLLGTETWHQAMAQVFSRLAVEFAGTVAQMIESWLLFETLGSGAGGGAAASGGAELGGIAGLFGAGGGSAGDADVADGGIAGGGFLGALFGGGEGAVSAESLGALAMFEAGTWSVPRDMIALVHEGEMILPAGVAEMARGGTTSAAFPNGGSVPPPAAPGTNLTLNVSVQTIDAGGVAQWANANAKTLASTISRYLAVNPSTGGA